MPFTLTMPKLSPTMEEGTIAKWHKKEGDFVGEGDLLIEVATDKATVEHNALDEGYLRKIVVPEGGEAAVNQAIAILSEKADEDISGYQPEGARVEAPQSKEPEAAANGTETPAAAPSKPQPASGVMHQPVFAPQPPLEGYEFEEPRDRQEKRLKVSPLARKLAKEKKLDISTVKGSGPGGRIMSRDLEKAQASGDFAFGSREVPTIPPGSYIEEKLTPMRKAIARRLQEAKTFIPHFYVSQSVDAMAMVEVREQLKSQGVKVTFNDFVIRACAMALRKHPNINSAFNTENNTIVRYQTIDVSVAVSMESGLITPIIRHADYKNLGEISVEMRRLAKRAKDGKLQEHEYKGGSFTVSNLGMFGVTDFIAIINPPQSSILAISGINDVPVVKEGQVVPGKVMNMTLSADHRVVDGVAGAQFINTVKEYLENPACLLI